MVTGQSISLSSREHVRFDWWPFRRKWEAFCPILSEKLQQWRGVLSQTVSYPGKPFGSKTRLYHKNINHHKPFKRTSTEKVGLNCSFILSSSSLPSHSSFVFSLSHAQLFPVTLIWIKKNERMDLHLFPQLPVKPSYSPSLFVNLHTFNCLSVLPFLYPAPTYLLFWAFVFHRGNSPFAPSLFTPLILTTATLNRSGIKAEGVPLGILLSTSDKCRGNRQSSEDRWVLSVKELWGFLSCLASLDRVNFLNSFFHPDIQVGWVESKKN